MDIRRLELFVAVIESPTMSQAAEKANLSASAVSQQMKTLARELKTELFFRSGRRLLPTPAGKRLAEKARQVIALFSIMKGEFPSSDTQASRRRSC